MGSNNVTFVGVGVAWGKSWELEKVWVRWVGSRSLKRFHGKTEPSGPPECNLRMGPPPVSLPSSINSQFNMKCPQQGKASKFDRNANRLPKRGQPTNELEAGLKTVG